MLRLYELKIDNVERVYDYIEIFDCDTEEDLIKKCEKKQYIKAITSENENSKIIYINPEYIEYFIISNQNVL